MIVVDSSFLVSVLIDAGPTGKACAARLSGEELVAPELIDLEVLSVLKRLLRSGKLPREKADRAAGELPAFPVRRASCQGLVPRLWELRDNFTPYDATYIALAEQLGATLVTGDGKFRTAPGKRCAVEVIR
ncbi:type II toxin-antitoxin system VapC family toxin [Streptomyces sp. NPDC021093]|uniref:type II toxin-antitoxin system VapC family toxin n=1 Tax=Streptomyces sp. NPDC021093 TaxID=3365112 RepID=UPI0037AE4300